MNRCRTCKHWYEAQRTRASELDDIDRCCRKITLDFVGESDDRVLAEDEDGYLTSIQTGANFGCVHYEFASEEYIAERLRLEGALIEENERKQAERDRNRPKRDLIRSDQLTGMLKAFYLPEIEKQLGDVSGFSDIAKNSSEGETVKYVRYKENPDE